MSVFWNNWIWGIILDLNIFSVWSISPENRTDEFQDSSIPCFQMREGKAYDSPDFRPQLLSEMISEDIKAGIRTIGGIFKDLFPGISMDWHWDYVKMDNGKKHLWLIYFRAPGIQAWVTFTDYTEQMSIHYTIIMLYDFLNSNQPWPSYTVFFFNEKNCFQMCCR